MFTGLYDALHPPPVGTLPPPPPHMRTLCVAVLQLQAVSGAVGSPVGLRVQDGADQYGLATSTTSLSGRVTLSLKQQPCAALGAGLNAACLPLLLRIASSNDAAAQGAHTRATAWVMLECRRWLCPRGDQGLPLCSPCPNLLP